MTGPLARFLFLLCVLLSPALHGCAPLLEDVPVSPPVLSADEEARLGDLALKAAVQQLGGLYPDPDLQEYVTQLGRELSRQSHRARFNWQFVVADRNRAGLHVLPGGRIVLTRGLLAQLDHRDQLAALLAHAIAHVEDAPLAGSTTRGLVDAAGALSRTRTLPPVPDRPDQQFAEQLIERRYRPEEELRADQRATQLLKKSGFALSGMVVFQQLYRQASNRAAWLVPQDGIHQQHPCPPERMAALPQSAPSLHGDSGRTNFAQVMAPLVSVQSGYDLFVRAQRLEADGNRAEALPLYLQAATAAPDEPSILTGLGLAYLRAGDLQSARVHLGRSVRLQPDYYQNLMGLGYALLKQGQAPRAVEVLEPSVALYPVTENLFLLAEGYRQSGRPDQARPLYETVAAHDRFGTFGRAAASTLKNLETQR